MGLLALVCLAIPLRAATAPQAAKLPPLRIGMVPDAGATQLSIAQKAPLRRYLEKALHRQVQLIIPTNYNATVEALGNGSLDFAYLGGLTYVKAHERYGAVPLVQRAIDRKFHSLFIAKGDNGITSLKQLAGKRFCFGDINSTSGHLYPRMILKKAGLPADKALKSMRYTGSHPATAQAVASGACDAGAIDESVYRALIAQRKIKPGSVRIFYTSPPFADYVWVARKGLPAAQDEAFAQALLKLTPASDSQILQILRGTHFVRASNADYADVARTARALGLL